MEHKAFFERLLRRAEINLKFARSEEQAANIAAKIEHYKAAIAALSTQEGEA